MTDDELIASWFGPIRNDPDPDDPPFRMRRKERGRRRYYRTLRRKAAEFRVEPIGWYDLMHWHVDWPGYGNRRWRERREHLAALFTMFRQLLAETRDWPTPHEAWLFIRAADSSQDAVYLHTRNPNRDNFPLDVASMRWDVEVPERLREFMTDPTWQFGRCDDGATRFFVRRRVDRGHARPR